MTLHQALRHIRVNRGLKQIEVGERMGLGAEDPGARISIIETTGLDLRWSSVVRYLDACEATLKDLAELLEP